MDKPTPSHGPLRRVAPAALALLLCGLLVATLVLRLVAHAAYLHDHESLMLPTVARELGLGHWGDLAHYRYNLYQGGVVVDGFLAAVGFEVFGDHALAWHWFHFAYAAGIALCGMAVLRRTTGAAGALAFALLLASAPFVLKDALITPAGHHASSLFYALLALWIAVGRCGTRDGAERRPGLGRGLAAGVVIGIGAWYGRSVVSVGPAVAFALLPGGRRALLGLGLGCLSLPAVGLLDAWSLSSVVPRYAHLGVWGTFEAAMLHIQAKSIEAEPVAKLMESLSTSLEQLLFAQPWDPGRGAHHPALVRAAHIWSNAWTMTPLLLLGAVLALAVGWLRGRWRAAATSQPGVQAPPNTDQARRRRALWGTSVVSLVVLGYLGSYVASPYRIDPYLIDLNGASIARGLSGPRYLVPGFLVLTLGLAQIAGLLWTTRWLRLFALVFGLALAGSGGRAAAVDWTQERDRPSRLSELRPYDYHKMFGPHRGPPEDVHRACDTDEPVSRANHLRSIGWFRAPGPHELLSRPTALTESLAELDQDLELSPLERRFVLHGVGARMADNLMSTSEVPQAEVVGLAMRAAARLGRAEGGALLHGYALARPPIDEIPLDLLCTETPWGDRSLCLLAGQELADPAGSRLTSDPDTLVSEPANWSVFGPERMRGLARELALTAPQLEDSMGALDAWPAPLAEGFRQGWQAEMARRRWKAGDPWLPERVP